MKNIKYAPTHCEKTGDDQGDYRFAIEQKGEKMLFVIGLNPSTANENIADRTMTRVLSFVAKAECDGFVMLNLSSQRQTNRSLLPQQQDEERHQQALQVIQKLAEKYPNASVLLAFGNPIVERKYFRENLSDIIKVLGNRNYLQIGKLTAKGYPRHPLYASLQHALEVCNVEKFKK